MKYLVNLKKIVLVCVKKGWLNRDPFFAFKIQKHEVNRLDVQKLKVNDLIEGVDGGKWIVITRQNLAKKVQQKALEENEALILLQNQLELHQQQLDKQVLMVRTRSEEYMQMGKVLTHDMQEPIRKIAFLFEALLEQKQIQQNSQYLRKVDVITKSVLQLRRRTEALFDFVNLHSLSEELSYLLVDELIREAETEVKRSMDFTGFTVLLGNLPGLIGRASQLKRMFVELIKNAVQNRKLDTPLVIRVHAVEIEENAYQASTGKYKYTAHLKIEFSDNGTGFDGQYASYVFGLLNKLHKNSDGVGLGLTLCKRIVSLH